MLFAYLFDDIIINDIKSLIYVPEFDNYCDGYLDVSVMNITVKSHLGKCSKGLLMGADIEKMKKYPDLGPLSGR
jgi:hypothetical protein